MALKNDSTVWTWGINSYGQLGNGNTNNSNTPLQVPITDVIKITVGGEHSIALKNSGTLWSWGLNGNGQLGNGTGANNYTTPIQTTGISCLSTATPEKVNAIVETTIYPNPFSEETTITATTYFTNATLILYNVVGEKVKTIAAITGNTIVLKKGNLPNGIYVIQLLENSKIITTKKLIISN